MTNKENSIVARFLIDHSISKGISKELSYKIEQLVFRNRVDSLVENSKVPHTIITADFGNLGSICIRTLIENEKIDLTYKSGSYDHVSVFCNTKNILWTDESKTEPYNRQGGLYANGSSWGTLELVKEEENYREFHTKKEYKSNISFAVWGFSYNDYWKSIQFGILLSSDKVEGFVSELRALIGK